MLYQITTCNACFGIETDKNDIVIEAAPIVRKRAMGRPFSEVRHELRGKIMPMRVEVERPQTNIWTPAKLVGIKRLPSGSLSIIFKLLNTGEWAEWFFKSGKIRPGNFNAFLRAIGKSEIADASDIEIPLIDDKDKLGMDIPVDAFVVRKAGTGKEFINISEFRKLEDPMGVYAVPAVAEPEGAKAPYGF